MATTSRISIDKSKIAAYTLPGGDVFMYTRALAVEMERGAKALVPVRTGALRRSIGTALSGTNGSHVNFRVSAGAGHALFVIHGTRPQIRSRTGKAMRLYGQNPIGWLNTRYAGYQGVLVKHVDGQLPNPFLQEAMHTVLVEHGLI